VEIGGHRPGDPEGGVGGSGGRVAGQHEVGVGAEQDLVGEGRSGGQDLPVGLEGEAVDGVGAQGAEVGDHQAAVAEAQVERAVGLVAGQGEVAAAAGVGDTAHHDLAVGLQDEGVGPVERGLEVGGDLAGAAVVQRCSWPVFPGPSAHQ
jgi:hypothetical protein